MRFRRPLRPIAYINWSSPHKIVGKAGIRQAITFRCIADLLFDYAWLPALEVQPLAGCAGFDGAQSVSATKHRRDGDKFEILLWDVRPRRWRIRGDLCTRAHRQGLRRVSIYYAVIRNLISLCRSMHQAGFQT
jgi:hypothetical protein